MQIKIDAIWKYSQYIWTFFDTTFFFYFFILIGIKIYIILYFRGMNAELKWLLQAKMSLESSLDSWKKLRKDVSKHVCVLCVCFFQKYCFTIWLWDIGVSHMESWSPFVLNWSLIFHHVRNVIIHSIHVSICLFTTSKNRHSLST